MYIVYFITVPGIHRSTEGEAIDKFTSVYSIYYHTVPGVFIYEFQQSLYGIKSHGDEILSFHA